MRCFLLSVAISSASAFSVNGPVGSRTTGAPEGANVESAVGRSLSPRHGSSTALSVWWFGGTPSGEPTTDSDDSCELVAVRIERTSPNSRRIGGEITVDRPIEDVWAILTDYDNLCTHVPNLVESRRINSGTGASRSNGGEQGDGSYTCRLFQKGSQNIIGFNFAASVTMDMAEAIVSSDCVMGSPLNGYEPVPEERTISFKCVESQFFTEFDGTWTVHQSPFPDPITGQMSTTVSYVVDVRPKGPVPVAALEWRIREDVPTNLRAVKKAAVDFGYEGVLKARNGVNSRSLTAMPARGTVLIEERMQPAREAVRSQLSQRGAAAMRTGRQLVDKATDVMTAAAASASVAAQQKAHVKLAPVRIKWDEDETMAAYLND